jgi:hypothetical protein
VLADEVQHCGLGEVGRHGQTHAARTFAAFLHRHQHDNCFPAFQLATPPQPRLRTADPGVIDFHIAVQGLAPHVDHGPTQLMQDQPRRLVAPKPQLSLQQQRRDATLVGRHQVRRPEPGRQWCSGSVQDGSRRQRDLVPALGAFATMPFAQRIRAPRGTVDSESPQATDTPPNRPGRRPPRQIAAGILGDWSGTAGAAQPYTTNGGLLSKADKHEFARRSLGPYPMISVRPSTTRATSSSEALAMRWLMRSADNVRI